MTPGPSHASPSLLLSSSLTGLVAPPPPGRGRRQRRERGRLPGRHQLPSSGYFRTSSAWKTNFFFFFFSPNQPAAQQLLFWRRFARFVPQSHLRDLQGNRGAAAPNGEWASLSVACTGFGLALQSGKLLTCFLGVDFAGGEGWETLETSQVRPQPCWEKAGSLTGKTAALPRSSAAPGSSPLPCNDSGP